MLTMSLQRLHKGKKEMKQKNSKSSLTKVISLRITNHDFNLIAAEAEEKNIGNADVIRSAWHEHLNQQDLSTTIIALEHRLTKKVFEMVTAVAGLDDNERLLALKKYRSKMKGEASK